MREGAEGRGGNFVEMSTCRAVYHSELVDSATSIDLAPWNKSTRMYRLPPSLPTHLLQELGDALALRALEAQALHAWGGVGWGWVGLKAEPRLTRCRADLMRHNPARTYMDAALQACRSKLGTAGGAHLEEGQHQLSGAVEDYLQELAKEARCQDKKCRAVATPWMEAHCSRRCQSLLPFGTQRPATEPSSPVSCSLAHLAVRQDHHIIKQVQRLRQAKDKERFSVIPGSQARPAAMAAAGARTSGAGCSRATSEVVRSVWTCRRSASTMS